MLLSFAELFCSDFVREVCVSEVCNADANGRYTHAGVHRGQPTYRLVRTSAVFWICYDGDKWCLVREEVRPGNDSCFSKLFCNELAGFAQGKVPIGRWLDLEGGVLCNIAYDYGEKARARNSSGYLMCVVYLV